MIDDNVNDTIVMINVHINNDNDYVNNSGDAIDSDGDN